MATVSGSVEPGYEGVAALFERLLAEHPENGAAICAYVGGKAVIDVWGGATYGPDTMQIQFSTTKGLTAIALAVLVQRAKLSLDEPVASYWPEFAVAGKGKVTVGDLLAHRAGVPGTEADYSLDQWCDGTVADALAAQTPMWKPGARHGYHALTFGVLANELAQRADGRSIGQLLADEVSGPLEADAFIGLPADRLRDLAPVIANPHATTASWQGPLAARAGAHRPYSLDDARSWNDPDFLRLQFPAANGVASARALARIYAACVGDVADKPRLLNASTVEQMTAERSVGLDAVLGIETRFGAGFQRPVPLWPMNRGVGSFGHDGFGGSIAFADPDLGMSFAMTSDRAPAIGGADLGAFSMVAGLSVAAGRADKNNGKLAVAV